MGTREEERKLSWASKYLDLVCSFPQHISVPLVLQFLMGSMIQATFTVSLWPLPHFMLQKFARRVRFMGVILLCRGFLTGRLPSRL